MNQPELVKKNEHPKERGGKVDQTKRNDDQPTGAATEGNDTYKSTLTDLIDDATYQRFDKLKSAFYFGQYLGQNKRATILEKAHKKVGEGIKKNEPGYGLKDVALQYAAKSVYLHEHQQCRPECSGTNRPNWGIRSWTRLTDTVQTPQDWGVPQYKGDLKETAKIIKQVAKNFGAFRTGITGLDKRHIYQHDCDGKEIVFESAEEPYETEEKRVIPEKCKYIVVMLVQMSPQAFACCPYPIGSMMPFFTYKRIDLLTGALAEFIRGLGYTAIPSANDTAINGPLALEAGLGELGRADKVISPDGGTMIRICKVITDLPMELDKPRKFGIAEFCKVCRRCVEACPVNTVNNEQNPSFKVSGPWSSPGHKTWHGENPTCWAYAVSTGGTCGICLHVCPFNKPQGLLHSLVRGIIKRTALFNRFFVWADKFFGYGKPMDPEKWWNLDLPTYGIDTRC